MKESDFQTQFKKRNKVTGVFELKLSKGKSIRIDELKEHQLEALIKANSEDGLYHKISDTPFGHSQGFRFHKKKPFDCFYLKNIDAYVVVMFYEPRKKKNVYYITVKKWAEMAKSAKMKSVREEVINNYATIKQIYV